MTLVMRVSWNSRRDLVSLDKINDFHTFLTLFPDQGFVFINELSLNWSDKGRAGFPPENHRPLWPLVQQHDVQVCLKIISACVKFGQRREIGGQEMFQKRRWKKTRNTHPPVKTKTIHFLTTYSFKTEVKQINIFGWHPPTQTILPLFFGNFSLCLNTNLPCVFVHVRTCVCMFRKHPV